MLPSLFFELHRITRIQPRWLRGKGNGFPPLAGNRPAQLRSWRIGYRLPAIGHRPISVIRSRQLVADSRKPTADSRKPILSEK